MGGFGHGKTLGPFGLGGAGSAQFFQPGKVLPGVFRSFLGKLLDHAGHVADDAHGHAPVAADLGGRGVDLDDLCVGGHVGRTAEADSVVLLAAEEHDHVGVAEHGGGLVQAPLEETEAVGVIVGNETPGLALGEHGNTEGFGKVHQGPSVLGVTGGLAGNDEWPLGLAQEGDGLLYLGLRAEDGFTGAVFVGIEEDHLVLVQFLFLDVGGDGQVDGASPAAEGQPHGPSDGVGNTAGVVDHQGLLGGGGGHAHLVNLLHSARDLVRTGRRNRQWTAGDFRCAWRWSGRGWRWQSRGWCTCRRPIGR